MIHRNKHYVKNDNKKFEWKKERIIKDMLRILE